MNLEAKKKLEQDALEYRDELVIEISNELELHGKTGEEAFSERVTDELEQSEVIDDFTPAFFDNGLPGKRHCHINGYSFSPVDGFMNIFVTKYSGDDEPERMGLPDVRPYVEAAINFVNNRRQLKINASSATDYVDCIDIIDRHMGDNEFSIRKFKIYLLTDGIVTDNVRKAKFQDIEGKPVEMYAFDILALYGLTVEGEGRGTLQIDFAKFQPQVVHCVPAGESKAPNSFQYASYMGVMPGTILADIYDEYGARLLEGNVRSFLSSKGAVNKEIRATILKAPEQFFAFNNGISVTASNVKFDGNGNLSYAEEFQIINGGQTTASLSNTRFCDKADLSQVMVLMKLTVTSDAMNEDAKQNLLSKISRASNKQNKVSDADFFSTHPFHVAIEKISETTPAPAKGTGQLRAYWFYERARGQYTQRQMKLSKSAREEFKKVNPPQQKITKTDLAKFRYSWEGKPYSVSKGAQSNFKEFANEISTIWKKSDIDKARLANTQYFKDTIALAIMYNQVGDIVSESPWYQNSFRANIVTYSIAMLKELLKAQYPRDALDLDIIWRNQELPPLLKKIFGRLTRLVYDEITNERTGRLNFTQRCKQKAFWEEMPRHVNLNLAELGDIKSLLISKEEQDGRDRDAKKTGKLLSGVELQKFVIEKGPVFWSNVRQFAYSHSKVGMLPKEQSALTTAARGGLPADFACKALLGLLRRCEDNGFKD